MATMVVVIEPAVFNMAVVERVKFGTPHVNAMYCSGSFKYGVVLVNWEQVS